MIKKALRIILVFTIIIAVASYVIMPQINNLVMEAKEKTEQISFFVQKNNDYLNWLSSSFLTIKKETNVVMISLHNGLIEGLNRSKAVGNNVVKMTIDIADQTNILALKAVDKVAKNGEQGIQFAAKKVKKLTEQAAEKGSNITKLIKTTQTQTMVAGTEIIQDSTQVVNNAGETLYLITKENAHQIFSKLQEIPLTQNKEKRKLSNSTGEIIYITSPEK